MAKKGADKDQKNNTEKLLLENFIALQKVLTDLSIKLDDNSKKVSRLLELFELAGKSYEKTRAISPIMPSGSVSDFKLKEISDKLDSLMEHVQVIAKGVILLEDVMRQKIDTEPQEYRPKPLPEM